MAAGADYSAANMPERNINPRHIAFIMDGNGRWAKEKGLPRTAGHRQGVQRVKEIVRAAAEAKIEAVTFFAFSTENWQRPKKEIDILMRFLDSFLDKEIKGLHKKNIKFLVIGRQSPLPENTLKKIKAAQDLTSGNTGMALVLALNYGARQEIVDAAQKICRLAREGSLDIENLSEDDFSRCLYTAGLPDPDLLVRTSGEMRISNFLLWQLSYAEFYFPKIYWPDFSKEELSKAIGVYQERERRFGRINVD